MPRASAASEPSTPSERSERTSTLGERSEPRTWLYTIATNACLDHLRRRPRQPAAPVLEPGQPEFVEITWLEPFPDSLVEPAAPEHDRPDAAAVAAETIELAFLIAIQQLPPRQRAVLILRDVVDLSAADTAAALDLTVPSVNSAMQRAKAALRGKDAIAAFFREIFVGKPVGEFRLVPVRSNGLPAAANYLRVPGDTEFRSLSLDVLRFVDGTLDEIVTFDNKFFPLFGLPEVWAGP